MSILGRRGSSDSGWSWSRPPSGPRRTPPRPPLLPLAAAGLIALLLGIAVLAVSLSNSDDNGPAGAASTATPGATTAPPATPPPTEAPTPMATPPATPTPVPGDQRALFSLAVWDGKAWQFSDRPEGAAYREGQAVPFLLKIDRALPGTTYPLTIRYDCRGFDFLTSYDRDEASEPALASGGPGTPIADSAAPLPDDPGTAADDRETGSLSLWGGSFASVDAALTSSACTGEKSLAVTLSAAADTLFLLWAAHLSDAASDGSVPLRLTVRIAGGEELSVEVDPQSVGRARP